MAAWRYESSLVLMKYQTIWYWYERRDLLCSRSKGDSEDIKFWRESLPGI